MSDAAFDGWTREDFIRHIRECKGENLYLNNELKRARAGHTPEIAMLKKRIKSLESECDDLENQLTDARTAAIKTAIRYLEELSKQQEIDDDNASTT